MALNFPNNPSNGQTWTDTSNGITYMFDGLKWLSFGGTGVVTGGALVGVEQIVAGPNITISPSGGTGVVTVEAVFGSGGGEQADLNTVNNPLTPCGRIVWLQRAEIDPPVGWLYCNGVDKARAQYNTLFNAIGTLYGEGDGVTTFGFPLKANLTPPVYAVDTAWNPFIKYCSRLTEPGEIFLQRTNETSMTARFVDGLSVGEAITLSGGTGLTGNPGLSADTLIASCGSTNAVGRNVFIWKRSGASFSLIEASPESPVAASIVATAVSPDGVYVAAARGAALNNSIYIYKANTAKTVYTQIATLGFAADTTSTHEKLAWSPTGNFLVAWGGATFDNSFRIFARSGDTFTESTSYPALPSLGVESNIDFRFDDAALVFSGRVGIAVASRVGNNFVFTAQILSLDSNTFTFWTADGTKLVSGNSGNNIRLRVYSWSGTSLSLFSQSATDIRANTIVLPKQGSGNLFYNTYVTGIGLYTWDATSVTLVGTTTPVSLEGEFVTAVSVD